MTRTLIIGSLAGLASAMLTLAAISGPFGFALSYLTVLPLFFAGFTHGLPAAAMAGAVGTMISGLSGLAAGGVFLVTFAAPAVLVVRQALLARPAAEAGPDAGPDAGQIAGELEWYPLGRILLSLVGWAAGLFALALLLTAGNEGGLPGTIQPMVEQVLGLFQQANSDAALPDMSAAAPQMAVLLPAVFAFGWLAMMVANGTLAQSLATMLKQNRRPSPQYRALTLPRFLVFALAAALVAGFVLPEGAQFAAITMATILAFPYLLQGLAVVHGVAAKTAVPGLILAAFYVALVVGSLGGFLIALVVILGLIEEWAGFRRRLAGAGASRENE